MLESFGREMKKLSEDMLGLKKNMFESLKNNKKLEINRREDEKLKVQEQEIERLNRIINV